MKETEEIVHRDQGFNQVAIWPGSTLVPMGDVVGDGDLEKFTTHMANHYATRVQFLEDVWHDGLCYMLFAIHDDDIGKFSIPRMAAGIRWIEEATDFGNGPILPHRLREYRLWESTNH